MAEEDESSDADENTNRLREAVDNDFINDAMFGNNRDDGSTCLYVKDNQEDYDHDGVDDGQLCDPQENSKNQNGEVVIASQSNKEADFNAQVKREREQYQPGKLESFFAVTKSLIVRALVIYFITSFFRRPTTPAVDTTGGAISIRAPALNLFENGTVMDMYMYVSEAKLFKDFDDTDALVWSEKGIIYGDWTFGPNNDGILTHSVQVPTTETVRNNGSLYLHVYATRHGKPPTHSHMVVMASKQLNRFKRLRYTKTHNLLTGETAASPEDILKAETLKEEVVSHWHPNLTVNIVVDHTNWVQGSVPAPLDEYIEFLPTGDRYKPVVYMNEFWNMLRDYQPINDTTMTLNLDITWQPLSLLKWQLYCAQSMRNKWSLNLMGESEEDEDQDSLKAALLETSPYLLAITVVISILHSVFELLAFKNDIQFWNNRKSLEGLSVRSVFFNVFQSLIVFLYVLDNDTNTVIKISCFVGLCIEVWKINKVVDIRFDPWPRFTDKSSYVASSTREYDMLAFRYLSWVLYPLLGGYAMYALIYQEHKGWCSFVLNMLYGFLLTFGFIMMTPQLFINYKLKSVAHLPWRMMSYKFLNTFIDDIFAFVIKMPTLYRLGCFRDDIVFFIFLYQRWIYKTDLSRINEFGFSGEMEGKVVPNAEAQNMIKQSADAPSDLPLTVVPPTDPKREKQE